MSAKQTRARDVLGRMSVAIERVLFETAKAGIKVPASVRDAVTDLGSIMIEIQNMTPSKAKR